MSSPRLNEIERSYGYVWDVDTLTWVQALQGSGGGGGGGAVTISNGADVNAGTTTDVAITSDADGTLSGKLRGLVKILGNVWDNVSGTLHTSIYDTTGVALGTYENPLAVDLAFGLQDGMLKDYRGYESYIGLLSNLTFNATGGSQPVLGGTAVICLHAVGASGGTTVSWEGSGDAVTFYPLIARRCGTNPPTYATSIVNPPTDSQWEINTGGLGYVRANVSNYSAGSISATCVFTAAASPSWVNVLDRRLTTACGTSGPVSGNTICVSPTGSNSLRIYYLSYNPISLASTIAFRFGTGGTNFLLNTVAAGSVIAKDYGDFRYLQGGPGESLVLNQTVATQINWNANYIEV